MQSPRTRSRERDKSVIEANLSRFAWFIQTALRLLQREPGNHFFADEGETIAIGTTIEGITSDAWRGHVATQMRAQTSQPGENKSGLIEAAVPL